MTEKIKLSSQPYKGTRDFYPLEQAKHMYIFDTWRKTLVANGFVEYDVSLLENSEMYVQKSGEELGSEQLYRFEDKGGRQVALRPEMTPSLARVVANKYGELEHQFPLRWFSIPNCFRYERPQKGRLREFWQLNADIIGAEAGPVDIELLVLLGKLFTDFGATREMYTIRYNNREWLDSQLENAELEKTSEEVYKVLDEWWKITEAEREEKLGGDYAKVLEIVKTESMPGFEMLEEVMPNVDIVFDATIVRGLAYYTGLVFECFNNDPDNNRAMFGGGRYDDLMDLFGQPDTPCVGVGVGDVTWSDFLDSWSLWPETVMNDKADIGVMIMDLESIKQLHTEIIPKLQSEGKTYTIDYDTERSENKRYKAMMKKCVEVVKL